MNDFRIKLQAVQMVHDERFRQLIQEGHTRAHDDKHTEGQLALLAAAYALSSVPEEHQDFRHDEAYGELMALLEDDYGRSFKPKDPIRDLVRAGALILAELERRLRAEEKQP